MKCVVINLERAYERREQVKEEFDRFGIDFEFSVAKDKFDLSEQDYLNNADRQSRLVNWEHSTASGALGCWMSHRKVWQDALREGVDMIAVFEDDVLLTPDTE